MSRNIKQNLWWKLETAHNFDDEMRLDGKSPSFDLMPECTRRNEFFMKWNFCCFFPSTTASYIIIIGTIKNVVCKQISLNFSCRARVEKLNSCCLVFPFPTTAVLTFTASRFSAVFSLPMAADYLFKAWVCQVFSWLK